MDKVRLSKIMAQRGLCSRREADCFIEQGQVSVDGVVIDQLGSRIDPDARIDLSKRATQHQQQLLTFLLNKPVGYVSGQPEDDYLPAVRLINEPNQITVNQAKLKLTREHFKQLAPAGRLDIDSQGLLVLTQNGTIARRLIGQDSHIEKEYLVRYKGRIDNVVLTQLRHGLELDGKKLKRARVDQLNEDQLRMVLIEGRKRQIRRMCELVGLQVNGLKRVRIGKVRLGSLPEGKWRLLAKSEAF